jgi:ABC-type protease/lipase transport system fused ATPase/permease subunit
VLTSEISAGAMIAASILLGRALAPAERAIATWRALRSAKAALHDLDQKLTACPPEPHRLPLPTPKGKLEVEGLRYTPPGATEPVIRIVAFHLDPGQSCAIIGPSGSGKSTLCRALVGAAAPDAGEIRLDGARLDHWPAEQLGSLVGYLPSEPGLFGGSVTLNVARLQDAEPERVIEAARRACAHELILKLPDGYTTDVGPGGSRLSSGERQRIALARALFGDPRLVVLDEPDAHLDQDGKQALAATLSDLKARGVTVIFVTHAPSLARTADMALVLEAGRSIAFGPADQVVDAVLRRTAAPGDAAARVRVIGSPPSAASA